MASVGGVQPDRHELIVKGTKTSRRIINFHHNHIRKGEDFVVLRKTPKDPWATSLRKQFDDLSFHLVAKPNRLAIMDEAFRVQKLVE